MIHNNPFNYMRSLKKIETTFTLLSHWSVEVHLYGILKNTPPPEMGVGEPLITIFSSAAILSHNQAEKPWPPL